MKIKHSDLKKERPLYERGQSKSKNNFKKAKYHDKVTHKGYTIKIK